MVDKIALVATIVAIAGMVAANSLSRMVENGELPIILVTHSDTEIGRLAAALWPRQTLSRAREAGAGRPDAGVDLSATASISGAKNAGPSLFPCGKDQK